MAAQRSKYERVPGDDTADLPSLTQDEYQLLKQRVAGRRRREKIRQNFEALLWIMAASGIIYYTDLWRLILTSTSIARPYFQLGCLGIATNFAIFMYLTVYLPYIAKITAPWDQYCPRMIPAATVIGIASYIMFMFAFWPVWGVLSPIILFVLFMGFFMAVMLIPSF